MDVNEITKLAITWGPTVIFLLILIVGLILGFARGFRKSGILAIHALVALGICLTAYFIIVNNPKTDTMIVTIANQIMGEGWLQTTMGVSSGCDSLKECLIEFIPKNQPYGDGLALIVRENGQYLGSLVNLAYHIVFAILLSLVYVVLVFLLYLIYFIFYPERRHKRKLRKKLAQAKTTKKYKKRVLLGGVVGGTRGLVSGLVCMSFLGSIFFILAGGTGTTTKNDEYDYDFGNQEIDTVHSIYQNIGSYGNSGIFKVLNTLKNKDDVPYYLFAAELVLQGGDVSVDENLKSNIALTNELSSMVKFGRQTLDLLLKNDDEGVIKNIILNNSPDQDVLTEISKIMCKPGFQESFGKIIDDFNANTYFINLSLSLIDSVCRHIDELELGLSSDVTDLICLLFKPGYKSPYVDEDLTVETPAYISASTILNEHDSKHLIKALVRILGLDVVGKDDVQKVLTYSKGIVPSLKELKILSSDSKEIFNPVLERLYTYLVNRYVPMETPGETPEGESKNVSIRAIRTELLNDPTQKKLDWIDEIQKVLDLSVGAISIADNVYVPGTNLEDDYLDLVFNIFDREYPTYDTNIENYNVIKDSLSSSSLLSRVMSETGMYKKLEEAIVQLAPEAYIEKDISYVNEYDENGNVTKHGEVYNLLSAVEKIMQDSETYGVVKELTGGAMNNATTKQMLEYVKKISTILSKDVDGSSAADTLLESSIASSVLSGLIISNKVIDETNNLVLYIPENDTVLKKDENGVYINIIKPEQITMILDRVPSLMDALIPFMDDDPNNVLHNDIDKLIERLNPVINNGLLDSVILEGTLVNAMSTPLTGEGMDKFITIPEKYLMPGTTNKLNVEAWIEHNEIEIMINGLLKSELKLGAIMNATPENQMDVILDQVKHIGLLENSLSEGPVATLLKSDILHASVSGMLIQDEGEAPLIDGLRIEVPANLINNGLIEPSEISNVIKSIPDVIDIVVPFITEGDSLYMDIDSLVTKLTNKVNDSSVADKLLESGILGYTLAGKLTETLTEGEIASYIKLPDDLLPSNPNYLANWNNKNNNEIAKLLYAIPASGLSINAFMDGELTNEKLVEQVTNIGNQSDEVLKNNVFGSRVLHKTVSNLLITFNSNGVEIVVPNPSRVSTDLSLVKVDELVDLLKAVPKLLSVDMTNQNELVKAIVKNAEELLAIPSLLTTVVNYLNLNVFNSIAFDEVNNPEGLIVIPAKLRADADKDSKLMAYDPQANSNSWQNEALSLIRSLDTMLGLSKLDNFDLNDQAWMTKTISDNIKLLNDPYVEGSKETKLKVVYNSDIMTSTLTHNLDKILEDESLSNAKAYNKLKADGIVPVSEMSTLVNVAKELDLDLINFNTDLLLDQVKNLNKDSTVKPGTSKSDLIYESNIAKILLTKQLDNILSTLLADKLDKIDVKETNEVFTGVFNYYKPAEIKELINMFNYLEIEDIQNPSFTELKLEVELKTIVANSTIIKSVLTGELQKIEQIVVPRAVLVKDSYINETEINSVLDVLISKKDDLFGAPVGNKYNITNFNTNNITVGLLKSLAKSTILSATAINAVNDLNASGTLAGVTIPTEYSVTKKDLVDSYAETLWAKNSELSNLINALGVIASDTDNINSLNEEKVLTAVDNLLVEDSAGVTNLHKAYSSVIIKASLSSVLDDVLTADIVDPSVKDHKLVKEAITGTATSAYKERELEAAIGAIQKGLGITHISDFKNVETIKSKILTLNDESVGYLHKSYIVWSALDKQIDIVVNSITDNQANVIGAKEEYKVDAISGGNRYKQAEISQILKLLTDQNITSLDTIELTSLRLDGDIKNIVLGSNIIKSALTVQVEKMSGIIVPQACYNTTYPFIDKDEIGYLLDILISNADSLFGTPVDGKHNIANFNIDGITFGILKSVALSNIFTATAINQINSLSVGIVVPAEYKVTENDLKTNYNDTLWAKNNEFENLVNSLGVFVADNDKLTEINTDTVINKIDDLLVVGTDGKTNLNKAYQSVIVRASLAKALDDLLTAEIVDPSVKNHELVKESLTASTKCYKEAEVESIIRALQDVFNISISSFKNTDAIKNAIINLDGNDIKTLYKSTIISSILSTQLNNVLVGIGANDTVLKNCKDELGTKKDLVVYKEVEVVNLLTAIKALSPTLDNIESFNVAVVTGSILNLTSTDIQNNINPSSIVWSILSDKLGTILSAFEINSLVDEASKYSLFTGYKAYTAAEVANLLQAIRALAPAIDDITKFDLAMVTKNLLGISKQSLEEKIYPSLILWNILSVELDKAFTSVNTHIKLACKEDLVPGYKAYKPIEVYNIILALNDLGLTDIGNMSGLDISSIDVNKVSLAYSRSAIIKDYITKKLDGILESAPAIVNHPDAKEAQSFGSTSVKLYTVAELNSLLGFTKSLGGSLSGFNLGSLDLTNSNIVGFIKSSAILNATFTKQLVDSNAFIMPDSVFAGSDNKLLNGSDLDALIDSLKTLGVKVDNPTANGITPSTLLADKAKFNTITGSVILRATITDKIVKAASGSHLYINTTDREILKVKSNDTYVLTSDAIYSFINAISKTGSSGSEFGLSLTFDIIKSLTPEVIYEACESAIARDLISKLVLASPLYATKVPTFTPGIKQNLDIVVDKAGTIGTYKLDLVSGSYMLHQPKEATLDELTDVTNRNVSVKQIEAEDVVALIALLKLLP